MQYFSLIVLRPLEEVEGVLGVHPIDVGGGEGACGLGVGELKGVPYVDGRGWAGEVVLLVSILLEVSAGRKGLIRGHGQPLY